MRQLATDVGRERWDHTGDRKDDAGGGAAADVRLLVLVRVVPRSSRSLGRPSPAN